MLFTYSYFYKYSNSLDTNLSSYSNEFNLDYAADTCAVVWDW